LDSSGSFNSYTCLLGSFVTKTSAAIVGTGTQPTFYLVPLQPLPIDFLDRFCSCCFAFVITGTATVASIGTQPGTCAVIAAEEAFAIAKSTAAEAATKPSLPGT
jgi:hypothetical protein